MDYYNYGLPQFPNTMIAPQYAQQQVNPYAYQQMQNNCQCDNRFMWIQGKEAAKAYPVAPNKTIFFLDDKESYAYLKKTDMEGKTTEFKVFQLIEEKTPEEVPVMPQQPSNVVTKDEFDKFSGDIQNTLSALMERIDSMNQKPYNKPYNNKRQVNGNG